MVRITTLQQQKFCQSDPVLIRQFSKKNAVRPSPNPTKIGFSPDPCSSLVWRPILQGLSLCRMEKQIPIVREGRLSWASEGGEGFEVCNLIFCYELFSRKKIFP